jgi:phenylalanyl-tRNA synthetase beta chain
MPVIGIPVDMLLERIQSKPTPDELVLHLQRLGCDVEGYATMRRFLCRACENLMEITETENPPVVCDRCGSDFKTAPQSLEAAGHKEVIRMELLAVRPDMFEPGGLARVLRNYFEESLSSPSYTVLGSEYSVNVDPALELETSRRPFIGCAIVKGMNLDDDKVRVIMKLQENLHWALGRDRKRASIGVYDLDTLKGSRFSYGVTTPEDSAFVPLGTTGEPMTPAEVLKKHPKGVAYARLLTPLEKYPVLKDEGGQVMALIPVINSEGTKVRKHTKNFFIDVTGLEERIVHKTLNTIVTSLLELEPGASLYEVTIERGEKSEKTPNLTPQKALLDPLRPARQIGVALSKSDVVRHLQRMGHAVAESGSSLEVSVPAYRNDIMHEVDLVEDIAISYGYDNIAANLDVTMTFGQELPGEAWSQKARGVMTGLGFFEVLTLILSNEQQQFDALRRERHQNFVLLEHPISADQTLIRTTLISGILDTLSANTDQELPQRIFEIGNVTQLNTALETGAFEQRRLAAAVIGPKSDYAGIRSNLDALLREKGLRSVLRPSSDPIFIPGRGADLFAVNPDGTASQNWVGCLGELHPQVLDNFGLSYPVAVFEILASWTGQF